MASVSGRAHQGSEHRRLGLKIAIADVDEAGLKETAKEVTNHIDEANLLVIPTDVSKKEQVENLRDKVYEAWGEVSICLIILSGLRIALVRGIRGVVHAFWVHVGPCLAY